MKKKQTYLVINTSKEIIYANFSGTNSSGDNIQLVPNSSMTVQCEESVMNSLKIKYRGKLTIKAIIA